MKIPVIDSYGFSDIGTIRPNNEDIVASLPSHHFFAIADGMGGHKAGEIASKEATDDLLSSVMKFLNPKKSVKLSKPQIIAYLSQAIDKANKKVFNMGQENPDFKGMGTTLCCLYFYDDSITYAHVGDSRLYRFRKNKLIQLTQDHSLIIKLANSGQIKEEQLSSFPYKNIITKALGTNLILQPSIKSEKYHEKDLYFMCTDGLSDYLSYEEILLILEKNKVNKKLAVNKLIEAAKKNGSRDNISTILIEIKEFNKKNDLFR